MKNKISCQAVYNKLEILYDSQELVLKQIRDCFDISAITIQKK